jgi:hypothetical protein
MCCWSSHCWLRVARREEDAERRSQAEVSVGEELAKRKHVEAVDLAVVRKLMENTGHRALCVSCL